MTRKPTMPRFFPFVLPLLTLATGWLALGAARVSAADAGTPLKVFILAGDEQVLENGLVAGRSVGNHDEFYPNAEPTKGEQVKHVQAAVYAGDYSAETDYAKMTPVATALVEIGYQRTRREHARERGQVNIEMAPFPTQAFEPGHTTVLRGYVAVKQAGTYAFHPGEGESAFNVTTLDGRVVYRRDPGEAQARIMPVDLETGRRYAFTTVFFKQPGPAFQLPMVDIPGTLETVVKRQPQYALLKDPQGNWTFRDDVFLYDAHPIQNNTEAPAKPVRVDVMAPEGPEKALRIGVDLMLSHRLGQAFDEPVLIIRYAVRHEIWFQRGSRDLSHDFRPPSSGGGSDLDGSWDVIHFNFGVWDASYREASSKYFSGHNTTSVEDFEKNLRALVGKMKKTGATVIWANVTPVWEGEPGKRNGDEDAYNRAAERVMKENGVIIDDLNAEARRQGFPKTNDVHSVGNLAPKVTEAITEALARRDHLTKPLPRVLFIGDSITGSYWQGVQRNLDGKAVVFKNPGNAEDTWNGLERMDEWLDPKRYLRCGQEYLELVDGVRKVMGDEAERACPGYHGQGMELAGVFWFHGDADGQWDSKAPAYEHHLANLIRDLCKDFNKPRLPVVVAALAGSQKMTPNQQRVFDAQMAVGRPKDYPGFDGHVTSIDTRPMAKPSNESPGGRDRYAGNAGSYLEIGDAMADAMLKLIGRK